MELDRKTWTWEQWHTSPYILSDFSSWGFVTASDGSPIDVSNLETWSGYSGDYRTYGMNIKWKYDKLASKNYNTFSLGVGGTGSGWGFNRGSFIGARLNYKGGTKGSGFNLTMSQDAWLNNYNEIIITPSANPKVFFIPLLNHGFVLNMRTNGISQQEGADPDGAYYRGQTPTLKTLYWNPGNNSSNGANKTIIALPPSEKIKTLGFTYIAFQRREDNPSSYNLVSNIWTDPNNVTSLQYTESISSINYDKHTNISQDVCTLIRYPYQNAFLDNLYIMSMMPKQFDNDVAYFSLAGRNFMKVFDNLVVELPTN